MDRRQAAWALSGHLAYFLYVVPVYLMWLARVRRYAALARRGIPVVGTVDWAIPTYGSKSAPRPTIGINGMPIGPPPRFDEYWVPYRFEGGGLPRTGRSPDGCPMFSRGYTLPAARLPTGKRVVVLYDPADPRRSVLATALPRYVSFRGGRLSRLDPANPPSVRLTKIDDASAQRAPRSADAPRAQVGIPRRSWP